MTVMRELATQVANSDDISAPLWRTGGAVLGAVLVLSAGGAASLLALLLLAAGVLLRAQTRVVAASAAFAAMILFKPVTAAILIYFALRADWRAARWTAVLTAVAFTAALLLARPATADVAATWRLAVDTLLATRPASPDQSLFALFAGAPLAPPLMALTATLAATVAILGLHLGRTRYDDDIELRPTSARLLLECAIVLALVLSCGLLSPADQMLVSIAGLAASAIIGAERLTARSKLSIYWIVSASAWLASILFVIVLTFAPIAGGGLVLLGAAMASSVALWRERTIAAAESLIPKHPFGKRRSTAPLGGDANSSLSNFLCSPLARGPSTNT